MYIYIHVYQNTLKPASSNGYKRDWDRTRCAHDSIRFVRRTPITRCKSAFKILYITHPTIIIATWACERERREKNEKERRERERVKERKGNTVLHHRTTTVVLPSPVHPNPADFLQIAIALSPAHTASSVGAPRAVFLVQTFWVWLHTHTHTRARAIALVVT